MKLNKITSYATIIGVIVSIIYLFWPSNSSVITQGALSPIIQGNQNTIIYADAKNPGYFNERSTNLNNLKAKELVEDFFNFYNSSQFRSACSLFKRSKCDATDGQELEQFSREREKQIAGYENVKLWEVNTDLSADIICAKYAYRYRADSNPQYIWEVMSFYVEKREDGINEITSRVCEKKFKEGSGDRNCPIQAAQKFCI